MLGSNIMTNSKFNHGSHKIHFVLSGITLIFLLLFIVQWNQIDVIIVRSSLPNCDCARSIEKRHSALEIEISTIKKMNKHTSNNFGVCT